MSSNNSGIKCVATSKYPPCDDSLYVGGFGINIIGTVITNTDPGSAVTLVNGGAGETLVSDGVGPALGAKSLTAGTGISLVSTGTNITVANTDPASAVDLQVAYDNSVDGNIDLDGVKDVSITNPIDVQAGSIFSVDGSANYLQVKNITGSSLTPALQALGGDAQTTGSICLGAGSVASGATDCLVLGNANTCSTVDSSVVGNANTCSGLRNFVGGTGCSSDGNENTILGVRVASTAANSSNVLIGLDIDCSGSDSVVVSSLGRNDGNGNVIMTTGYTGVVGGGFSNTVIGPFANATAGASRSVVVGSGATGASSAGYDVCIGESSSTQGGGSNTTVGTGSGCNAFGASSYGHTASANADEAISVGYSCGVDTTHEKSAFISTTRSQPTNTAENVYIGSSLLCCPNRHTLAFDNQYLNVTASGPNVSWLPFSAQTIDAATAAGAGYFTAWRSTYKVVLEIVGCCTVFAHGSESLTINAELHQINLLGVQSFIVVGNTVSVVGGAPAGVTFDATFPTTTSVSINVITDATFAGHTYNWRGIARITQFTN